MSMAARLLARRTSAMPPGLVIARGMAVASNQENAAAAEESLKSSWFQRIKGLFVRDKPAESKPMEESKPPLRASIEQASKPSESIASKIVNTVKSAVAPSVYSMEAFADELKKARYAGSLVKGASKEQISAILEKQEKMIRALATYKTEQIGASQVAEVAVKCKARAEEVEDILSKYKWTKEAHSKVEKLRKEGKPLPKSFDEVEALMGGRWKSPKSVPILSRNQLCSCGSGKKYKRCCGQTASI
ncbi:hypothetical protein SELMODRAFT_444490 [Selaginella moellendorffii]|uniref:Uncharacterized protein n=1 Tax=Selaginella moellendorffii TaxID=88036 RepID=D8SA29_SELML|nr:uncharacterized protein LOC9648046 [Selaginella moellendorffii]EFJ18683.1 hypothetical protein SELMODRAFT_444490 [Selaginella moellendorffii]|eukprot:XP_002980423.1 uncharacterized protein LOC9648046 [Selaginella moellendorffii]